MSNNKADSKQRKNHDLYEKIKDKLWFRIVTYLLVAVLSAFIGNRLIPTKSPSPDIDITYNFIETKPLKADFSGDLHVDYESDQNINGLQIFIRNIGDKNAKDLEIKVCTTKKEIQIKPAIITFNPTTLKKHIVDPEDYNEGFNGFYRKFDIFQSGADIYILIWPKKNISENDIKFEFSSELKKWIPKKGDIESKQSKGVFSLFGKCLYVNKAFAEDAPKNGPSNSNSGNKYVESIGGYNPLRLANNLFVTLQMQKLISKSQAREIVETIESDQKVVFFGDKPVVFGKKKVLFGGIDILKFNKLILDALIENNKISKKEALEITEKSKKAGGVMISGYNVVVLDIEIMTTLIKNNFLDLKTAQLVLDSSKHKILTEDGKPLFDRE